MLKKKIILSLLLSIIFTSSAFAADVQLKDYIDPLNISSQSDSQVGVVNSVAFAVGKVLDQVFGILGIIALCIIVYSGILYITSLGKSEKAKQSLKYMQWAVIGLVVIFLSYAIVRFVLNEIPKIGQ